MFSPLHYPEPQIPQSDGEESKGWPTDPPGWKSPIALQPMYKKVFRENGFSSLVRDSRRTPNFAYSVEHGYISVTLVTSAFSYAY